MSWKKEEQDMAGAIGMKVEGAEMLLLGLTSVVQRSNFGENRNEKY